LTDTQGRDTAGHGLHVPPRLKSRLEPSSDSF
jgi:hypothetical protein